MKKKFRTDEERIRKKLFRMECDDLEEEAKSNLSAIVKDLRERLVRDHPEASVDWIEAAISRHLSRGMKPTTATLAPPQGVPAAVQTARKAARRALVKKGRPHRR